MDEDDFELPEQLNLLCLAKPRLSGNEFKNEEWLEFMKTEGGGLENPQNTHRHYNQINHRYLPSPTPSSVPSMMGAHSDEEELFDEIEFPDCMNTLSLNHNCNNSKLPRSHYQQRDGINQPYRENSNDENFDIDIEFSEDKLKLAVGGVKHFVDSPSRCSTPGTRGFQSKIPRLRPGLRPTQQSFSPSFKHLQKISSQIIQGQTTDISAAKKIHSNTKNYSRFRGWDRVGRF